MIILLRKKSLWIIIGLMAALVLFWGGYWGNIAQSQQTDKEKGTIPTMAASQPNTAANDDIQQSGKLQENTTNEETISDGENQLVITDNVSQNTIQAETIQQPNEISGKVSDDIIAMRAERNRNRDMQLESLKQLAQEPSTTASVKEEAERKIIAVADEKFLELQSENLLKTKGYKNALVMIDFNNAKIYVGEQMAEKDYIKIGDLVHKSTDFSLEQIIIIPK